MAQREALRELQARLAQRLQAAQTEGMSVSWLAVTAGGAHYLLPLGQAGEIVPLATQQSVPYTQAWFLGVLNVRGNLVGLVDLAGFVATLRGEPATARAPSPQACAVTVNAALDVNCALRVDSLAGLRGSDAFTSQTPAPADGPAFWGPCYEDAQGLRWQVLDLRALVSSPRFLHIAA